MKCHVFYGSLCILQQTHTMEQSTLYKLIKTLTRVNNIKRTYYVRGSGYELERTFSNFGEKT